MPAIDDMILDPARWRSGGGRLTHRAQILENTDTLEKHDKRHANRILEVFTYPVTRNLQDAEDALPGRVPERLHAHKEFRGEIQFLHLAPPRCESTPALMTLRQEVR